jgi:cyanophycin synthetase
MNPEQAQEFELKLGGAQALPGYLQGLAQPCVRVLLHVHPATEKPERVAYSFDNSGLMPLPVDRSLRLSKLLASNRQLSEQARALLACLERFNHELVCLQESAGCPVCSGAVFEQLGHHKTVPGGWSVVLVVPSLNPAALIKIMPFVLARLNALPETPMADGKPHTPAMVMALLDRVAPSGTNTRLFLAAAYELGVPVQRLHGQIFQYGWGAAARWTDSSFTDAASGIAARLARDKVAAHNLLARAGLPVAEQVRVANVAAALQHAERMGYPVVIKPADLDGGKGVEAGISNSAVLEAAFARSKKHSKNLILERHIKGEDYRLGILYGRVSWVTYREPAGVWGDGSRSVQALIEQVNQDPRRGTRRWSQMVPVTVNAEAEELLVEQGYTLADTPQKECFVRLRRSANTSSGGTPIDMTSEVHPDNAALAEQVARLFRLDIAGIDLICPDISRSWRELGGVVCEVNGQPQFTLTRPCTVLAAIDGLVAARGRIPVIVILAELAWGEWASSLLDGLSAQGVHTGLSLADGLWLAGEQQRQQRQSAFADVQALQLDTSVQAIVVATDAKAWLQNGVPLDQVDLVVSDKNTDPRVLALLTAAGRPTCWRANMPLATGATAAGGLNRLAQMMAEVIVAKAEQDKGQI